MNRRPAWAEVDLSAIAHNVAALRAAAAPAELCAVVKADGYGHGAVPVARAAVEAGASWLAVALTDEGLALRAAGLDVPILLLSEPAADEWDDAVRGRLTPTVYSRPAIAGLAAAAAAAGGAPVTVHLKVDTGMHRVGAAPDQAVALCQAVCARPELRLGGVWTHCAVADEPDHPFTTVQLERFDAVLAELRAAGSPPFLVHAANSAAAMIQPRLRHDLVRCGIAVYGLDPSPALHGRLPLRPALTLKACVSHVQVVRAGEAVSYGLRRAVPVDSVVATVPLGYADGVPRRLSAVGGEALVGGRRRPLAGTITMDQLLLDCGPDAAVAVGDEVVLLGRQGGEGIGADDWAGLLGTINYEIVCGISPRVRREYR